MARSDCNGGVTVRANRYKSRKGENMGNDVAGRLGATLESGLQDQRGDRDWLCEQGLQPRESQAPVT